jgi:tetratricopeptide (TPR) repeat protein
VLNNLEAESTDGHRIPGLLESPGVTPERLRAFAEAAVVFYTARPWDHLTDADLIAVDCERISSRMRHICVLGAGGQQFGLSFFNSRAAYEGVIDWPSGGLAEGRAYGVTFGPVDELPFGDVDAWLDHALPVADADAYPLAADFGRDGSMRRPDAHDLTSAEALLRALAETTEADLDAGQWKKRVRTFDGDIDVTLTLPFLLEAEAGRPSTAPPVTMMPRLAERARVRIGLLTEGRSFESSDDLNAEIDRASQRGLFGLPAEEVAGRELTPLERAQELAYDAMEAEGRVRIKRARQALEISPDCADAWVVLAEDARTPDLALERYEHGVAAGVRAIGSQRFEDFRGEFWEQLATRPYMRARLGLAQTLAELGRRDEAIVHYRDLLRLNPDDNQGVRDLLLTELLELGRDAEVGALLDEYVDDIQALWPYARALWLFRTEGNTPRARAAADAARRVNPHAVKYLLDPAALPIDSPTHYVLGSKDEGVCVAEALGPAYSGTPGAIAWLRSQARKRRK